MAAESGHDRRGGRGCRPAARGGGDEPEGDGGGCGGWRGRGRGSEAATPRTPSRPAAPHSRPSAYSGFVLDSAPTRHPGSSRRLRLGLLPTSHPDYAIDRASAAFITRRLNAWDWGPMSNGGNRRLVVSNGGNRRLATRIKSSVQQADLIKYIEKISI
uniref:Uncharacterized protein n=1 Tax=Oryza sativa subsp. japonica TaxID=39947 RepID=Q6ZDG7_ORYSJ|nr:hypothetical protein [Oryza sativa Japonica Group]